VRSVPRIPLIEDLTTGSIPRGSTLLVEFDPVSQWYNASLTIAAGWLRQEGALVYHAYAQSPDDIRLKLTRMGVDPLALEKNEKLQIWDWYTCQLGRKSKEKFAIGSLKVADLSIQFARDYMHRSLSEILQISDSTSAIGRFNDEKQWVEYVLTRIVPATKSNQSVLVRGLMKGVHTDWVYKQHEGSHHGVIDFKLEEEGKATRDLIRIRTMQDVGFDREWHELKISDNFEVTLAS